MAKFKFHWGINTAIFYIAFVVALIAFVIFTRFNQVDLVDENYYDKEIKYQSTIDKIERTNKLDEPLKIETADSYIRVSYPKLFKSSEIKGEITFFRPSDKTKDFTLPVKSDDTGYQVISSSNMTKGMWRMKIDWAVGDSTYYSEEVLVIN